MKNILIFGIRSELGGVETIIMNYYRFFDRKKINVEFLSIDDKMAYEDEIIKMGGKIHKICPKMKNYFKYKKDMDSFFKNNASKYDTIWVNLSNLANIDYLKYAKKYGIKKRIIHCHNSNCANNSNITRFFHYLHKPLLKKYATDFWSCSLKASNWFYSDDIIKGDKFRIINNAISYDNFKYNESVRKKYRKDNNLNDKLVFCNIGRLSYQKNQEFLLDIFNGIVKREPSAFLIIIGDGEDKEKLKNKVKDIKLNNNVLFMGLIKNVSEVLQASDIFLFPSLFEGLALSLVEAQSSNLPIFTSNTVSGESIMSDYFYQYSLDLDPDKWAEKIIRTYKEIPDRNKRGNTVVENGFDIKEEAKKVQKLL